MFQIPENVTLILYVSESHHARQGHKLQTSWITSRFSDAGLTSRLGRHKLWRSIIFCLTKIRSSTIRDVNFCDTYGDCTFGWTVLGSVAWLREPGKESQLLWSPSYLRTRKTVGFLWASSDKRGEYARILFVSLSKCVTWLSHCCTWWGNCIIGQADDKMR